MVIKNSFSNADRSLVSPIYPADASLVLFFHVKRWHQIIVMIHANATEDDEGGIAYQDDDPLYFREEDGDVDDNHNDFNLVFTARDELGTPCHNWVGRENSHWHIMPWNLEFWRIPSNMLFKLLLHRRVVSNHIFYVDCLQVLVFFKLYFNCIITCHYHYNTYIF